MRTSATRLFPVKLLLAVAVTLWFGVASVASAAILNYGAVLDGPSEFPPNASTGIGSAEVTIDDVAHTMRVRASFAELLGTTTVCHIHGPTAVAGTGTAGVATTTPTFPGFPAGVTSGTYDQTFDLTQLSSYNPSFVAGNGGSAAGAEAALLAAIAAGKAYFNVHSSVFGGGEIRGFLLLYNPTPATHSTWGRIKQLYR